MGKEKEKPGAESLNSSLNMNVQSLISRRLSQVPSVKKGQLYTDFSACLF